MDEDVMKHSSYGSIQFAGKGSADFSATAVVSHNKKQMKSFLSTRKPKDAVADVSQLVDIKTFYTQLQTEN
ncbi:hypothetical protein ABVT39_020607 [Epinephelus coioides]